MLSSLFPLPFHRIRPQFCKLLGPLLECTTGVMSSTGVSINRFSALCEEERITAAAPKAPVAVAAPAAASSTAKKPAAKPETATRKTATTPNTNTSTTTKRSDKAQRQPAVESSSDSPAVLNSQEKPHISRSEAKPRTQRTEFDRRNRTGRTDSKVKVNSGRQGWKTVIDGEKAISPEGAVAESQAEGTPVAASLKEEPQRPSYKTLEEFLAEQQAEKQKLIAANPLSPTARKLNEGVDKSVLNAATNPLSKESEVFFGSVMAAPKAVNAVAAEKKESKKTFLNLAEVKAASSKKSSSTNSRQSTASSHADAPVSGTPLHKKKTSSNVDLCDSGAFPSL